MLDCGTALAGMNQLPQLSSDALIASRERNPVGKTLRRLVSSSKAQFR
ncbi:hypothetical protein CES85_3150 (plasmid) [Ochrobactrum quorumnocens]|uniref:Uncharacterized protein n=1 Tax=Ochrobactrum quorumnocens TaxID=271865 RepID=A0A248UMD9_9HYPH|nr:hypothetical protein CES85_3150 [[Ochrobactrum] quorumnocens]